MTASASTNTIPAVDVSAHRPAIRIAARRMSSMNYIRHNCFYCWVVLVHLLLDIMRQH